MRFNFSHCRLLLCLITLIQTNAASAQFKQNMCQKIFLDSNKPSLEQVINSLVLSNLSIHDTSELSLKQSLMSKLNDELKLLKSIYDEDAVLKYYHELSEIHKSLSKGLNKEKSNNDIDSKFIPYIYPMDLNSIDSYFFATKMNQRFFVAIDQKSASLQVIDTEKINKPIQIIPIPAMINNANMHPKPNDTHIAFLQRNQLILKAKIQFHLNIFKTFLISERSLSNILSQLI